MSIIIPQLTSANGAAYQRQVSASIEQAKYLVDNSWTNDLIQYGSFWIQTFSFYDIPDQVDDNYDIFMTPIAVTGSPPPEAFIIEYVFKYETDFHISWADVPGVSGETITWRWKLFRWV